MQSISKQVHHHDTINSPLLFGLFDQPDDCSRLVILDSGELNASSLQYYNKYRCRIYVSRLIYSMALQSSVDELDPVEWKTSLSKQIDECDIQLSELDIILLWDLPNYLSLEQLTCLCTLLIEYSSRPLKMHAYIYNTRFMPDRPQSWRIHANDKVSFSSLNENSVPCPVYSQTDLKKHVYPYHVDHVVMLSSGIEEYIFSLV